MPFFDFAAPAGEPVVYSRFWIYWAIMIPLTVAVLLTWFMSFKFRKYIRRYRDIDSMDRCVIVRFLLWMRFGTSRGRYQDEVVKCE